MKIFEFVLLALNQIGNACNALRGACSIGAHRRITMANSYNSLLKEIPQEP